MSTAVTEQPVASHDVAEMVFDTTKRIEVPVKIDGKPYVLKEATGAQAVLWRNQALKAARFSGGQVVGMEGAAESEPFLVSLCLWEPTEKGFRQVPKNTIKEWPARVQKALFERAKEISALNEDDNMTAEQLKQRIATDTARLNYLTAEGNGKADETTSKNEHGATTESSE